MSAAEIELETITAAPVAGPPLTSLEVDDADETGPTEATDEPVPPNRLRSAILIATIALVPFSNAFDSETLTVALPTLAQDLGLPQNLLLWPASVNALGVCCALLPLSAIADVVGNRPVFLLGSFLFTVWTLAVSLSRTPGELIAFRALQGVSMAFCTPTAISTITTTFPSGKLRNVAFATTGAGYPLGGALGLVLGGALTRVSGWRTAYYLAAAGSAMMFISAWFVLPKTSPTPDVRHRLRYGIDWVGAATASCCLAILSYLFSEFVHNGTIIKEPYNIVLLILAVALIPFFIFWVGRQERLGRPAIVPNSVWRKREFTIVCLSVFLVWSWFNSFAYFSTLYFQVVQDLDALQAGIRYLPMVVFGILTNILAGLVMHRVSAGTLVLISGLLSAVSPILFALQSPTWTYWAAAFPAMCLSVLSTDLMFTISNLVITSSFPSKDQALAGGIFSTVAQLGNSIGPAVTAIIASAVTASEAGKAGVDQSQATLQGYRSAFWACFAAAVVSAVVSIGGLRKAGAVGAKKDV